MIFVEAMSPVVRDSAPGAVKSAYPHPARGVEAAPGDVGVVTRAAGEDLEAARRAQLILYARTQYGFYAAFQTLVVVLAVAASIALVSCIVLLLTRDPSRVDVVVNVGVGVGALVTGAAAKFIQNEASAAKDRYLEAVTLLQD